VPGDAPAAQVEGCASPTLLGRMLGEGGGAVAQRHRANGV